MAKKEDISEQLREREERRKKSVVGSMISSPPLQSAEIPEETSKPEPEVKPPVQPGVEVLLIKKSETKSRRKQITLHPSVHDRAAAKCARLDISMNDVINQLLDKWSDM